MHVSVLLTALSLPLAIATSSEIPIAPTLRNIAPPFTIKNPPSTLIPVATPLPPSPPLSAPNSVITITSTLRPTKIVSLKRTHTYSHCGGLLPTPQTCAEGHVCVDDPLVIGCGMACDMPGICVPASVTCAGFIGKVCPTGMICVDNPADDCDPKNGGFDCIGVCV